MTMSESKGWYEEWQKKTPDEIKTQEMQTLSIGMEQIAAKAKTMAEAITKKDFMTAGDSAAWINFLMLPHVYPGQVIPSPVEGGQGLNLAVMQRLGFIHQ